MLTETIEAKSGNLQGSWNRKTETLSLRVDGESLADQRWTPGNTIEAGDEIDASDLETALQAAIRADGSLVPTRSGVSYEMARVMEIIAVGNLTDDGSGDLGAEVRTYLAEHPLADDKEAAAGVAEVVAAAHAEYIARINVGATVCAGRGDDKDEGKVIQIGGEYDGRKIGDDEAVVAWSSGVRTPANLDSLILV